MCDQLTPDAMVSLSVDDVLSRDSGECSICLDDMFQGDTIARLPCLCVYHKGYEKPSLTQSHTHTHTHVYLLSSVEIISSSAPPGVLMNGLRSTGRVQNILQINIKTG